MFQGVDGERFPEKKKKKQNKTKQKKRFLVNGEGQCFITFAQFFPRNIEYLILNRAIFTTTNIAVSC